MTEFSLTIHGHPRGKGRPRFNTRTGRAYTPDRTVTAQQQVQGEWIAAGRPELAGPLSVSIEAALARPQSHWRTDGTLGKHGLAAPWPCKRPDIDNIIKLILDSLVGQAFVDDVQVVIVHAVKRWAHPGERENTKVRVTELARGVEATA